MIVTTPLPDDFPDDALAVTGDGWAAMLRYEVETGAAVRSAEWHDAMAEMYLRYAAQSMLAMMDSKGWFTVTPVGTSMAQAHATQALALRARDGDR